MADTNSNGEDKPKVDPQKQYLIEQFGNLMEKVGEGYGGPLQEELIRRMEQTIADFDEEVSEMLESLRDNSVKRHEKLKEIWEIQKNLVRLMGKVLLSQLMKMLATGKNE